MLPQPYVFEDWLKEFKLDEEKYREGAVEAFEAAVEADDKDARRKALKRCVSLHALKHRDSGRTGLFCGFEDGSHTAIHWDTEEEFEGEATKLGNLAREAHGG